MGVWGISGPEQPPRGTMATSLSGVNHRQWLLRVTGWDGLLPLGVAVAPSLIQMLLPNRLGVAATALASVILPGVAFHLRIRYGQNHISSNGCSITVRRVQYCAFYVGIVPLALVDFILVFRHADPKGIRGILETPADWAGFATCVATYIVAMVVAMYPGAVAKPECLDEGPLDAGVGSIEGLPG
jgi:hypothetical protein